MSDDEDVTYVKKHRSIHYGSLEEQERARLVGVTAIGDDNNGESGPSTVSENAQVHISNEYMDLEDAMSKDKQALLEEFERRKKARQINVSTDDAEVKRNLRQLGEPICLFGEGPAERRSRLKDILSWNAKKRGVKSNDTPKKRHRNGRLHDLSKVIRAMSHKTGEDCGCKRYECFKKITKKERDRLIAEFNALQSKDKQSLYLSELISILPVHKRRSRKVESVKTRKAKNKSSRKSPRKSKNPRKTRNPRKLRTPSESENDSPSESESPIKSECISPNKSDNVIPSKSDTISASNSDIINPNAPDTSTIKAENTVPVKTKKVAGPHEHSYKYKVRILREGKLVEVQVCHKAFISLHGITNQTLFTIKKSLTTNKKAPIDGRGKHKNRTHAISQETLGKVCDHIRSCRMYLPEKLTLKGRKAQELSIKKLHRMYMEQHPLNLVSYEYYRTVCSNKFNISFGSPRSDKCSICEAHQAEVRDLELKKLNAIQVLNDINNELQKVKAVSDVHKKINHVTNGSEITNKNSLGY